MRKFKLGATVATAAIAAAAVVPAYAPAKSSSFKGSYSGVAKVVVKQPSVTISSVSGKGSGSLGLSSLSGSKGSGHTSGSCAFFSGPATLSGSGGSIKLTVKSSSTGCGTGDNITVKGTASVSGGSGKLSKAKGTLSFSGKYNKGNGAFTVTISGSLSS